jgi:hypothetical protein
MAYLPPHYHNEAYVNGAFWRAYIRIQNGITSKQRSGFVTLLPAADGRGGELVQDSLSKPIGNGERRESIETCRFLRRIGGFSQSSMLSETRELLQLNAVQNSHFQTT